MRGLSVKLMIMMVLSILTLPGYAYEVCTISECQDSNNIQKSGYEKIADQNKIKILTQMWKLYHTRNEYCFSDKDKTRVEEKMEKIKYPNLKAESMSTEDINKALRASAEELSHEFEHEMHNSCLTEAVGIERKVRDNLKYLHAKFEMNLDRPYFWLTDMPEYDVSLHRRGAYNSPGGSK